MKMRCWHPPVCSDLSELQGRSRLMCKDRESFLDWCLNSAGLTHTWRLVLAAYAVCLLWLFWWQVITKQIHQHPKIKQNSKQKRGTVLAQVTGRPRVGLAWRQAGFETQMASQTPFLKPPSFICVGYILFVFLVVMGFELRALHRQNKHSTAWATLPVYFTLVNLEMGSHKLYAQAGFEPWPSGSYRHEPLALD
jgi:hypothetical protein